MCDFCKVLREYTEEQHREALEDARLFVSGKVNLLSEEAVERIAHALLHCDAEREAALRAARELVNP